ncbi:MAG TPA: cobalamin-binding protein [Actinomycetota bacterium]|nr:cobalamin-binding protein [Actinomycetota bacterium]
MGTAAYYGGVRIVSLLPSATEMLFALGLSEQVVGVTHECDWPEAARGVRRVSVSVLPPAATPAEIDARVSASLEGGEPIYRLDPDAIRELAPDLVITQDLCAVCAVPSGHVHEALDVLGCPAQVVSLDPGSLDEVIDCVATVGAVTGRLAEAESLVASLHGRLAAVEAATRGSSRPAVFALEWGDPPYNGGHWLPEMVETAGGRCLLGSWRAPSVRVTWDAIAAAGPEVVVFMPCGYDLAAAVAEGRALAERPELAGVREIYAANGGSYFSRPGPRLVDGVEALAAVLHPGVGVTGPFDAIARIR